MERRPEDTLTPREFEATALLAGELTQREIAQVQGISVEAVKKSLANVRRKTGKENSVGVALWFRRKYPTEEAEQAGYDSACEYLLERTLDRMFGPRNFTHARLGKK